MEYVQGRRHKYVQAGRAGRHRSHALLRAAVDTWRSEVRFVVGRRKAVAACEVSCSLLAPTSGSGLLESVSPMTLAS